MDNCVEQTNTGEGVKDKEVRTTSDDAGGKSVSEKSKSVGAKCVSENSTTTCSLTDAPIHIHFPLLLTQQYIRSTVTLPGPHTFKS
jgi:hypothetical protein